MDNNDIFYVREQMLPEQAPPATQSGAVKWMRENLFSSWFNSVLTLLALYFVVKIVTGAFPWFANGVWVANSLAECREILQGETGGCFAVLTERWHQLLFGFKYPSDQYWRPALALCCCSWLLRQCCSLHCPQDADLYRLVSVHRFLADLGWNDSDTYPCFGRIYCRLHDLHTS